MPGLRPIAAAPDAAAVERFRLDVTSLLRAPLLSDDRLGLAVSGGADSMAMLTLAHAAFPGQVIAATVDHRLRPESAREAAMVAAHCLALRIPHATLVPSEPIVGASLQAQARLVRYALLLNWAHDRDAQALLTAHHADDQAETFLMRAARGSGIAGLAAIRVSRQLAGGFDRALPLIRPLLGWRRAELRALAEAGATPFVDDPSNRDFAFDRARFRHLIEHNPELDVEAIAATANFAAEAEQALMEMANLEWIKRYPGEGTAIVLDMTELPRELRRRLTRYAISAVRDRAQITTPEWSDAANIEHLLNALEAGGGASKAGVMASAKGPFWHFRLAPPRRSH